MRSFGAAKTTSIRGSNERVLGKKKKSKMHLNIRTGVKQGALRISKHSLLAIAHWLFLKDKREKKIISLSIFFLLSFVGSSFHLLHFLFACFFTKPINHCYLLLQIRQWNHRGGLWTLQIHFHWEISFSCFHACPKTLLSVGYFIFLPFSLFDFGVRVSNFVSVLIESLEAIYEFWWFIVVNWWLKVGTLWMLCVLQAEMWFGFLVTMQIHWVLEMLGLKGKLKTKKIEAMEFLGLALSPWLVYGHYGAYCIWSCFFFIDGTKDHDDCWFIPHRLSENTTE